MKDGRGWHQEPMRHSLAARGIPSQREFHGGMIRGPLTDEERQRDRWENDPWLREQYPTYGEYRSYLGRMRSMIPKEHMDPQGRIAQDVIFSMAREDTGSHFLDSGSAYGYIYQKPISEDGLIVRDDMILISTPHFLAGMLEFDENTDDFNFKLQEIWDGTKLNVFETSEETLNTIQRIANERGVEFNIVGRDNTYNSENDLDQDFEGRYFHYNNEMYIILSTHNGCDVRGGYSTPHVFKIVDEDYFSDVRISFHAVPIRYDDPSLKQMTMEGDVAKIVNCDELHYESVYGYSQALSEYNRGSENFYKDGMFQCPICGDYHIGAYNPGIHGF